MYLVQVPMPVIYTTGEVVWLRNLLSEIGSRQAKGMNPWRDNESAMHIANNQVFHERTKHTEVDCHSLGKSLKMG